jgi:hypothetical protein
MNVLAITGISLSQLQTVQIGLPNGSSVRLACFTLHFPKFPQAKPSELSLESSSSRIEFRI